MKNSVFISTNLSPDTGGGNVSAKELEFLMKNTNVTLILANRTDLPFPIPIKSINPLDHSLPEAPFLWDYLAHEYLDQHLRSGNEVDILFINGSAFGRTVEFFKEWYAEDHASFGNKVQVIVDCPAHNLQESIAEHEKFGVDYKAQYPHMVDDFLWDMQSYHILEATDVIVPSKHSLEALRKLDLVVDQKFHIIPHGCNLPEDNKIIPPPSQFRVGYVGSLGYDKGAVYLISAWQNLGYSDAVLAYAGPHKITLDDPGLDQDGKKKGWIYRIPPFRGAQYKIFGWLPSLDEFYQNISLFVCPAVTEGFNLEVLEAMSFGRPVLCSTGAGASDLIVDGENGFTFEPRDIKRMMELIDYCKKNPDKLAEMGKNARTTSLKYDWNSIIKQYESVLE